MNRIVFYTTLGCHLCEQAEAMLSYLLKKGEWYAVDIAEDDQLIEEYGTKIPVLSLEGGDHLLHWPFNLEQLIDWIQLIDGSHSL